MALRTFRSNPSLGGFGSESTNLVLLSSSSPHKKTQRVVVVDGDAFAQIIKELVDNAVDACRGVHDAAPSSRTTKDRRNHGVVVVAPKRVRVEIQTFTTTTNQSNNNNNNDNDDDDSMEEPEILRVTVTDNGCGMRDIQACVDPFYTSKAHATTTTTNSCRPNGPDGRSNASSNTTTTTMSDATNTPPPTAQPETAGRYGIGLTLCLLHAQRLVPGSTSSIRSAQAQHAHWTTMSCVVEPDAIQCVPERCTTKTNAQESGTSVSLLVPGGVSATIAWPRLAEYFARFKLSLGMQCSLEVWAPTLSRVPLCIRPLSHQQTRTHVEHMENEGSSDDNDGDQAEEENNTNEDCWVDGLSSGFERHSPTTVSTRNHQQQPSVSQGTCTSRANPVLDNGGGEDDHLEIWKAAQLYLGRTFSIANVAHATVPIRIDTTNPPSRGDSTPKLEVGLIVHGPDDDNDDQEDDNSSLAAGRYDRAEEIPQVSQPASMVLVRMVNRIPLLDSSEAVACGLVQSVAAKKRMWNSFGLDVTYRSSCANVAKLLTFEVRDSEQVAPFFQRKNHAFLGEEEVGNIDDEEDEDDELDPFHQGEEDQGTKRRRRPKQHRHLLPASARLGNILAIVQIHAQPSNLPLPTLSKGRLPVDNQAIENAMELALTQCLRQLQLTSPHLLLTASELRTAERDARYVPAVASSLASILSKSTNPSVVNATLQKIRGWQTTTGDDGNGTGNSAADDGSGYDAGDPRAVEALGHQIENRLRMIISSSGKKKGKAKKQSESDKTEDESQFETEEVLEHIASDEDDDGSMEHQCSAENSLGSPSLDSRAPEVSPSLQQQNSDSEDFEEW